MSGSALAGDIGVSMAQFDDNFLTVLRNGIRTRQELDGVTCRSRKRRDDVDKQISQIQNFIAARVDAIIVNPVDTGATPAMTKLAADAGIPLVYVNREPASRHAAARRRLSWPRTKSFRHARNQGSLPTAQGRQGRASLIMMGELANQAARAAHRRTSTSDRHAECKGIKIVEEQTANWIRAEGAGPDDQLDFRRPQIRRGRLQQRRDGDRRHPGLKAAGST